MLAVDSLYTINDDTVRFAGLCGSEDIFDMCSMIEFHFVYTHFFIWINSFPPAHDLISLFFSGEILYTHIIVC